jgi:hypothetical protein
MVRLTQSQQEEALQKVRAIRALRKEGLSEDEIAKKLNFTTGLVTSAEVMYGQLERWEFPDWLVYPEGYGARRQHDETPKNRGGRRARTFKQVEELPQPARAEHLFRRDLQRLSGYVDELRDLREHFLADPQRWVSYRWIEDDWEIYYRSDHSEEQWQRLCEQEGVDPATTESLKIDLVPSAHPRGAKVTPSEGLVYLMAVHAIMNDSIESLVKALHPNPDEVDLGELYKKRDKDRATQNGIVTNLKTSAEQLAKVVRGGKLRKGMPPPEVSRWELWMAWDLIHPLAEKALANEQILEELGKDSSLEVANNVLGRELTANEIGRLRKLGPPPH